MINLTDYNDFFIFLGGFLIIGGIIYVLVGRRLQKIFIAEQEAERLIPDREISRLKATNQLSTFQIPFPKIPITVILLVIIVGSFLLNQFLLWRVGSSGILNKLFSISINITRK